MVHFAVMPDHFRESIWYGGFFLATASTQIVVAVRLLRKPSRSLVVAVVATSAWIIALWAWTRLVGVPIGPDNGATEPLGVLDGVASVAEFCTVGFGLLALRGGGDRAVGDPRRWPLSTARCFRGRCRIGVARLPRRLPLLTDDHTRQGSGPARAGTAESPDPIMKSAAGGGRRLSDLDVERCQHQDTGIGHCRLVLPPDRVFGRRRQRGALISSSVLFGHLGQSR